MKKYYTNYSLMDKGGKKLLIFIHGLSSPMFVWKKILPLLDIPDYDFLIYDLWGRGKSEKPEVIYNTALYHAQLDFLKEDILKKKKYKKISYAGMSLGGFLAASYGVKNKKDMEFLILLDPLGFHLDVSSFSRGLLASSMTEKILERFSVPIFKSLVYFDFYSYKTTREYRALLGESLLQRADVRGFTHSVLSTLRNLLSEDLKSAYEKLSDFQKSILMIWGENDRTIPLDTSHKLREILPDARLAVIAGTGHIPHFENPEICALMINRFINPGKHPGQ